MVDGPFAETKELIAGYTLIRVKSRAEALGWARRYPNPAGEGADSEIEVRQLFESCKASLILDFLKASLSGLEFLNSPARPSM